MIVQKFNQGLEKYSHFLTALRLARNGLAAYANEEVFGCLVEWDTEEKGYFTGSDIVQHWLGGFVDQQQAIKAFMQAYFNYEQISYTIIVDFLLAGQRSTRQDPKSSQLPNLITSIFQLSFRSHVIQQQILTKMHHFIPMKYAIPSQEEFSRYAICQNITVDLKQISSALNLLQTHLSIQNNERPLSFQKTLANPSVSNLQDIMKRLQNRVSTFGNDWLVSPSLDK